MTTTTTIKFNVKTVYATACSLSIIQLHQTEEEAKQNVASKTQTDDQYWYVKELAPGQLNNDLYQGSDGGNNYIQYNEFNGSYKPEWLEMA
jgi:hypothetical protein